MEKVASGIFLKKYHVSLFLVNILKILQKLSRHVLIHFYFRRPATNIFGKRHVKIILKYLQKKLLREKTIFLYKKKILYRLSF